MAHHQWLICGMLQTALVPMTPDSLPREPRFDLVVANILKGPLVELAPTLAAHSKPGGRLGLSGILEGQVEAVQLAYSPYFGSFEVVLQDQWALLTAVRLDGQ